MDMDQLVAVLQNLSKDDPDIDVVGIGKHSSNEKVQHVINDGFSVYVPGDKIDNFKNYDISGSIESVIR